MGATLAALILGVALVAGCGGDDDGGDQAVAPPPTPATTEPAEPREAVTGAGVLTCEIEAGSQRVSGEGVDGTQYGWMDLTSVTVDWSTDAVTVTWEKVGAAPDPFVSPGGLDSSVLHSVMLSRGPDLVASLDAQLIGSEWFVSVRDWETNETEQVVAAPSVDGGRVTVSFPRDVVQFEADSWFALVEGDGGPDSEFADFEVLLVVQDTCPRSDSFIVPEGDRLPFTLN